MRRISKEGILNLLKSSNETIINYENLRHPFGYTGRIEGKTFMLLKLFKPSITEDEAEHEPEWVIRRNIMQWAQDNRLFVRDPMMFPGTNRDEWHFMRMDKLVIPESKYNVGDRVWFGATETHIPFGKSIYDSIIQEKHFSEDTDWVYHVERFRGPIRFEYLEGELFDSEDSFLKYNERSTYTR